MKISQHKLELMEAISNNIQRERQNKHLSQSKLAALCGVSPSCIKNIENAACHINFGVVLFLRICKALQSILPSFCPWIYWTTRIRRRNLWLKMSPSHAKRPRPGYRTGPFLPQLERRRSLTGAGF